VQLSQAHLKQIGHLWNRISSSLTLQFTHSMAFPGVLRLPGV
jgi:hypothetical protein